MNEELPKDTKYSWLIVAISFYGQIFSAGILFSFGPLYVEILKVYKVSETTAGISIGLKILKNSLIKEVF